MAFEGSIAGYTYKAENYSPEYIMQAMGYTLDDEVSVEQTLTTISGIRGIDREDEISYDSENFPKVIFETQITCADQDWADDAPDHEYEQDDMVDARCMECGHVQLR